MKILRILAFAEGVSLLLLLLIAMPLKYAYDKPWAVENIGMIHGVLFIAYGMSLLYIGMDKGWKAKIIAFCLFLAIVPAGTFYADRKYFKD